MHINKSSFFFLGKPVYNNKIVLSPKNPLNDAIRSKISSNSNSELNAIFKLSPTFQRNELKKKKKRKPLEVKSLGCLKNDAFGSSIFGPETTNFRSETTKLLSEETGKWRGGRGRRGRDWRVDGGKLEEAERETLLTEQNKNAKKTENTEENEKIGGKIERIGGAKKSPTSDSTLKGDTTKDNKGAYTLFGVELSADTGSIATVYFVQGVLGLARLAVSFFLKDELGLDPAETAVLTGITAVPWLIKPLYGFISDGLPLFGYRRRSYLVLCGLLGALSWGLLASVVHGKYEAVALICLSSLSVAVSDVVVDSMVVERARGESQAMAGSLQSLCWASSATGGIVSAYFSGALVESYGSRFVFGITALLPLMTSAVGALVREDPVDHSPSLDLVLTSIAYKEKNAQNERDLENRKVSQNGKNGYNPVSEDGDVLVSGNGNIAVSENGKKTVGEGGLVESIRIQMVFLWETVKQPTIFLPTLFIFLWQATPRSDTALFYFLTNQLGFGPEFLGRVNLVTSVASLVGVGLYNTFLKEVRLQKVFFWTSILGTTIGLTQLLLVTGINRDLGISDQYFAIGDSLVLTVLGQASFMPVLVLAARLCPPGVEATLFATLMSVSNGGGVVGGILGASLTHFLGVTSTQFDNLPLLIVICNVSSLWPLFLLKLLPSREEMDIAVSEAQEVIEAQKTDE